jgi:hypothetical protein
VADSRLLPIGRLVAVDEDGLRPGRSIVPASESFMKAVTLMQIARSCDQPYCSAHLAHLSAAYGSDFSAGAHLAFANSASQFGLSAERGHCRFSCSWRRHRSAPSGSRHSRGRASATACRSSSSSQVDVVRFPSRLFHGEGLHPAEMTAESPGEGWRC